MTGTVLVTGGAGYVGSHTCKALAAAGWQPVVYDDLSTGHEAAVKWGPLERGSLFEAARLAAAIETHKPVAVLHFAGLIAVGESVAEPLRYYRANVAGTLELLRVMRDADVRHLVFSSSAAVYGTPETVPIPETHPTRPGNPYGHSKLMIEQVLADAAAAGEMSSVALRYFNAAGADPDGELGEAHDPETHLIPLVLDAALGRRDGITMFGDDYDTPDGTCVRDYIHVADLADAHVRALARLDTHSTPAAEVFNLGNARGYSVREVIETARTVTGRPIPAHTAARRPGDPAVLVAANAEARRELGWKPARADLAVQIADAWRWHQAMHATTTD